MTFKKFMSATGVPERTLRRMIANGELKPAQHNPKGKPSYFDEQNVATAKALYEDLKHGKKSPTKAAENKTNDVEAAPVAELKIDLEFQQLIPPLSDNERNQLEANILRDGIQDPLKVWQGVIVDGHNRYSIAQKHGLTFKTTELHFDDRDAVKQWIVMNQFGRRNINRYSRGELALKLEATYTDRAKSNQGARNDLVATAETNNLLANLPKSSAVNTRDELAKIAGVSPRLLGTIKYLVDNATEEIKIALRNDAFTINAAYEAVKAGAMTVDDVTEFKTHKEKSAPKSQHTEEPARPPVENPPTNDSDDAGKIFVGNKPIDSLKSIVVPDDDSEQSNTPSEDNHPHELESKPAIVPNDDNVVTAAQIDKPTAIFNREEALSFLETSLDCIELFGGFIDEQKQKNFLQSLVEYWHELEKYFPNAQKLMATANHIMSLVDEIARNTADLAVKVTIEIDRLKAEADEKKSPAQDTDRKDTYDE